MKHRDMNYLFLFFFFNDTAPTVIYTLSLHDALPILIETAHTGLEIDHERLHTIRGCDQDRKSTRLNSSHPSISYDVFCLKKKTITILAYSVSMNIANFSEMYSVCHPATSSFFVFLIIRRPPRFTLFPYTTLFR